MPHEWMRQMPSVGPSVRISTLRNIMSSAAAAIMLATPSSHLILQTAAIHVIIRYLPLKW